MSSSPETKMDDLAQQMEADMWRQKDVAAGLAPSPEIIQADAARAEHLGAHKDELARGESVVPPTNPDESTVAVGGLRRHFTREGRLDRARRKVGRLSENGNTLRATAEAIDAAPYVGPNDKRKDGTKLGPPPAQMGWPGYRKPYFTEAVKVKGRSEPITVVTPNRYRPTTWLQRRATKSMEHLLRERRKAFNDSVRLKRDYGVPRELNDGELKVNDGERKDMAHRQIPVRPKGSANTFSDRRHLRKIDRDIKRLDKIVSKRQKKIDKIAKGESWHNKATSLHRDLVAAKAGRLAKALDSKEQKRQQEEAQRAHLEAVDNNQAMHGPEDILGATWSKDDKTYRVVGRGKGRRSSFFRVHVQAPDGTTKTEYVKLGDLGEHPAIPGQSPKKSKAFWRRDAANAQPKEPKVKSARAQARDVKKNRAVHGPEDILGTVWTEGDEIRYKVTSRFVGKDGEMTYAVRYRDATGTPQVDYIHSDELTERISKLGGLI